MSNLLATQTYRANQVNGASPLDLLLMTYDAALIGCGQRDLGRTIKAIELLRDALDFSYDENIALGFFRLYQYCADLVRKGEYDEAAGLLRELREAWAQVKNQYQPAQPVAATPVYQEQNQSMIPGHLVVAA